MNKPIIFIVGVGISIMLLSVGGLPLLIAGGLILWGLKALATQRTQQEPKETHRRFAVFYLAHVLETSRHDDTAQAILDALLRADKPETLARMIFSRLDTQQDILVNARIFAMHESIPVLQEEDFHTALGLMMFMFASHAALVNRSHEVAETTKVLADEGDVDGQMNYKLSCIKDAIMKEHIRLFGKDCWEFRQYVNN